MKASNRERAAKLASRIEKRIFAKLDERNMDGLLLVDRWNRVRRLAYPGEKDLSMGNMFDRWYETRNFESKL
jgi:hypothetical protein